MTILGFKFTEIGGGGMEALNYKLVLRHRTGCYTHTHTHTGTFHYLQTVIGEERKSCSKQNKQTNKQTNDA
jgi:hypothetical protein